jgi:hypothetical protein
MLNHTFQKSNRLDFSQYTHSVSLSVFKIVADIREAFLEEIRPKGISCLTTSVSDIREAFLAEIRCFATFVLAHS